MVGIALTVFVNTCKAVLLFIKGDITIFESIGCGDANSRMHFGLQMQRSLIRTLGRYWGHERATGLVLAA